MTAPYRLRGRSAAFAALAATASVLATACGSSSGPRSTATPAAGATASTPVERLVAAYYNEKLDPSRAAWEGVLADADFGTKPVTVVEFARLRADAGARAQYDGWLDALAAAMPRNGGEMISVNDILMPGLEGLEGYEEGMSWIATFPSLSAFVDTMLDERVAGSADQRRAALDEAQMLAGANLVPPQILQLPPNEPASAFPTDRVAGRTPGQIVADLLAVYPSGGADPTAATLEAITSYSGFMDQRVHFVNLYRFNEAPGGGAAALGEYNAAALPHVLRHGARPKALVNVSHHLVGPTEWDRFIFVSWPSLAVFTNLRLDPAYLEAQESRVVSGEAYGNLITIARADRAPAD